MRGMRYDHQSLKIKYKYIIWYINDSKYHQMIETQCDVVYNICTSALAITLHPWTHGRIANDAADGNNKRRRMIGIIVVSVRAQLDDLVKKGLEETFNIRFRRTMKHGYDEWASCTERNGHRCNIYNKKKLRTMLYYHTSSSPQSQPNTNLCPRQSSLCWHQMLLLCEQQLVAAV